jgi:RNA recognition motif-containing protein
LNSRRKDGGFEGAREDKEEEQKEKNTTKRTREILDVFVRNLPHSTTDESLENAFSEIGLVRQAWVAREKGTHCAQRVRVRDVFDERRRGGGFETEHEDGNRREEDWDFTEQREGKGGF